jgi:predicted acyl esterase
MTHLTRRAAYAALVIVSAAAPCGITFAQTPATPADPAAAFEKTEVMVPMRDGVKLHTTI